MQKTILMKLGIDKYTEALKTWVTGQISDSSAKIKGLSYDPDKKELSILDLDDKSIGTPLDVSNFVVDGMLDSVVPETDTSGKNTGIFIFSFKTSDSEEPIKTFKVDFGKYVDTYTAGDETINVSDNKISVKCVYDDQTTIKEDIAVMGGPLANSFPSDWKGANGKKAIPKGKTLEDILKALVYQKAKGSVRWGSPSAATHTINNPTVYLSKSSPVEVGTKVSISTLTAGSVTVNGRTATCNANYGYYLADSDGQPIKTYISNTTLTVSAAGGVDGSASFSGKWNSVALNETKVGTELVVKDGTNTLEVTQSGQTATWNKLPYTKVFAAYNDGDIAEDVSAELNETTAPTSKALTSSSSATINAYYKYYIGYSTKTDPASYTPADIISSPAKSGWINGTTMSDVLTSNGNSIVIACPNTYKLSYVENTLTSDLMPFFTRTTGTVSDVPIGGDSKITYNIYIYKITNNTSVMFKNVKFTKIK